MEINAFSIADVLTSFHVELVGLPGNVDDLSRHRFGRLVALFPVRGEDRRLKWACRCDCGSATIVPGFALRIGNSQSCGCIRKRHPEGLSRSPIYSVWNGMMHRCSDIKNPNYGGRGISVCPSWRSYERFHRWAMRTGYAPGLTIDRRDVNGNYSPANCRWIPLAEQAKNTRRTVWVTVDGQGMCLMDAARHLGLSYKRLRSALKVSGGAFEDAVAIVRAYKPKPRESNFRLRR